MQYLSSLYCWGYVVIDRFAGKRKYRSGHTKHRKVPQGIGLLTSHFHMIKPEFTLYTLLFLVFAKTYIVGTRYEASLTCAYNLNALARKKKIYRAFFTCENYLFHSRLNRFIPFGFLIVYWNNM